MKEPPNNINNKTARFILSAYRANGADALDPTFAEALDQARRDPDLAKWFEEQRAFDEALTSNLQKLQPPEELRSAILSGFRAVPIRPRFRPAPWLGLAAALVLAGMIVISQFHPFQSTYGAKQLESYALAMVSKQGGPSLDYMTPDLQETRRFLEAKGMPYMENIPSTLERLSTVGCRALKWHGYDASLTCFSLKGGMLLHLFVLDGHALGSESVPKGVRSVHDWHIKMEKVHGLLIVWASQVPMDEFEQLVYLGSRRHSAGFTTAAEPSRRHLPPAGLPTSSDLEATSAESKTLPTF